MEPFTIRTRRCNVTSDRCTEPYQNKAARWLTAWSVHRQRSCLRPAKIFEDGGRFRHYTETISAVYTWKVVMNWNVVSGLMVSRERFPIHARSMHMRVIATQMAHCANIQNPDMRSLRRRHTSVFLFRTKRKNLENMKNKREIQIVSLICGLWFVAS